MRQGGFAESGGTEQEEMVEGFLSPDRRFDKELKSFRLSTAGAWPTN